MALKGRLRLPMRSWSGVCRSRGLLSGLRAARRACSNAVISFRATLLRTRSGGIRLWWSRTRPPLRTERRCNPFVRSQSAFCVRHRGQICSPRFTKFAANNRMAGTPEEYKAAVHGCNPHWGHYSVAHRAITFKIEHAMYANWEGTEQKRPFTIKGDELTYKVQRRPLAEPLNSSGRKQNRRITQRRPRAGLSSGATHFGRSAAVQAGPLRNRSSPRRRSLNLPGPARLS